MSTPPTVQDARRVEATRRLTKRKSERRERWAYRLGSVGVLIALLGVWEALPRLGLVSEIILPRATDVGAAIIDLGSRGFLWGHMRVTLNEIMWGFLLGMLIGITMGIVLAVFQPVKRLTYPFIVAFQAIPKVVFAPLFIVWFGFGQTSKVVMAIVIAFFPVLVNTMVGLETVPQDALRLMRSLRATRMQTFWKVRILHAAPLIFAGIKTALTFAVIGVIVGEFVGAREGLGYLLDAYHFQLRIDRVFALIVMLSLIGSVLYFIVEWVDRKLIFWSEDRLV
jgi:NitT/TauT family transport system permease protein